MDWKAQLYASARPEYAEYQEKIISDTKKTFLCVRMAALRRLAKDIAREIGDDWRDFPSQTDDSIYEETLLAGLVIAYAKVDMAQKLDALWDLFPRLDSWGMTDAIAPTLKPRSFERAQVFSFAKKCLAGEGEYVRRFGIVLLVSFFRTVEYRDTVLSAALLPDERYYVAMAQAWMLAEIGSVDFPWVCALLESGELSDFVHNMTIRKIRESFRFTKEQKERVLAMRRKKA